MMDRLYRSAECSLHTCNEQFLGNFSQSCNMHSGGIVTTGRPWRTNSTRLPWIVMAIICSQWRIAALFCFSVCKKGRYFALTVPTCPIIAQVWANARGKPPVLIKCRLLSTYPWRIPSCWTFGWCVPAWIVETTVLIHWLILRLLYSYTLTLKTVWTYYTLTPRFSITAE